MTRKRIGIIHYGMGNIQSVCNAVDLLKADPVVIETPEQFQNIDGFILPGVGSFSAGIKQIKSRNLFAPIQDYCGDQGLPLLGICLGMQLLAGRGEEGGGSEGLNLIPGTVKRINSKGMRIPHIGWNKINTKFSNEVIKDSNEVDFYFLHSYSFHTDNPENTQAEVEYGSVFTSAVAKDNIYGMQFHPEKSHGAGLALLSNFILLC